MNASEAPNSNISATGRIRCGEQAPEKHQSPNPKDWLRQWVIGALKFGFFPGCWSPFGFRSGQALEFGVLNRATGRFSRYMRF
jgi:hypothetical protein